MQCHFKVLYCSFLRSPMLYLAIPSDALLLTKMTQQCMRNIHLNLLIPLQNHFYLAGMCNILNMQSYNALMLGLGDRCCACYDARIPSCDTSNRSGQLVDSICEVIFKIGKIYWCLRSLFARIWLRSISIGSDINSNDLDIWYWITPGIVSPNSIF